MTFTLKAVIGEDTHMTLPGDDLYAVIDRFDKIAIKQSYGTVYDNNNQAVAYVDKVDFTYVRRTASSRLNN